MKIHTLLVPIAAVVVALYFAAGACFFRFAFEPLVLPHLAVSTGTNASQLLRIRNDDGNAVSVRTYGTPKVGCVVFFPGQHGLISAYERDLFPAFSAQGVAVIAVAYPGQDGAPGTAHLAEIPTLAAQAVAFAQAACPGHRVVVYGRSLGAMVAAYAAATSRPSGLILEGAAPSFSSAIRARLNSRWYLAPLTLLPVSKLIARDYSLAEALPGTLNVPAVVFQGTADIETPLSALRTVGVPGHLRVVVVTGGEHSTTYLLARDRIIQTTLSMLRGQVSA